MSNAPNKTQPTDASVEAYLGAIADPGRRDDCRRICAMMSRLSDEPAVMWGPGIVGFGSYHYHYDSGRQGDAPRIGFSSRKTDLTLYCLGHVEEQARLLERLGRHTVGKSCLYLKRLADVDLAVLAAIIEGSLRSMDQRYPRV